MSAKRPTLKQRRTIQLGPPPFMTRLSAASTVHTGADTSRARSNWRASSGSADSDLLNELPTLRARARDMGRNGIGAGVLRTMVDHVVGERGIRAQSRIDPEVFDGDRDQARQAQREIEAAIEAWSRCVDVACRMDWPAAQRLMFRSLLENGDVLIHIVPGHLPGPHSDLALELIEADRLETPLTKSQSDLFRGGVEFDARGIPRAYHILKVHPGDFTRISMESQRIARWNPAGRPNALHVFEELRVGQSRGVPFFAPVLADFDHRGDFKEAELYAGRLNAYLAVAITKEQGYEEAVARTDSQGNSLDDHRIEEFDHGMVEYLQAGEDIKLIDPKRPGSNAETFLKITDSDIGAALGIPVELIRKDFRDNTWHSARQSSLELERSTKGWQALLIRQAVGPLIEMAVENAIYRGECPSIDLDTYGEARTEILRFRWSLATRGLVDPGQENEASETGLRLNLTTLADECAARGRDYEEVIEQRARELEMEAESGTGAEVDADQPAEGEVDPNLALRNALDTYGIAVRAGVVTPQTTDEDHFRRLLGLPAASGDVRTAWGKDKGTRRPITITPAGGAAPAPAFGQPAKALPNDEEEEEMEEDDTDE